MQIYSLQWRKALYQVQNWLGTWKGLTQLSALRADVILAEPLGPGSSPQSHCFVLHQWKTDCLRVWGIPVADLCLSLHVCILRRLIKNFGVPRIGQWFTGTARICFPWRQIKMTSVLPSFACSSPEEGVKVQGHDNICVSCQEDNRGVNSCPGNLFAVISLLRGIFALAVLAFWSEHCI